MGYVYIIGGIICVFAFFRMKKVVWDAPHDEIKNLRRDLKKLQELHKEELSLMEKRLQNSSLLQIQENEFVDIMTSYALRELLEICKEDYDFLEKPKAYYSTTTIGRDNYKEVIKKRFRAAVKEQYKYRYLIHLYPELEGLFVGMKVRESVTVQVKDLETRNHNLLEIVDILQKKEDWGNTLIYWKNRVAFLEAANSNLTAIPYMAAIMADYETYGIEHLAKELDWGYAKKRLDKVKAIREIRKDARAMVEKNKEAQYQLAYLLNLFPNLEEVIDAEFSQLPVISVTELSNYDSVKDYLSKEEYAALSEAERNQLALDRYKNSHKRSKWQIGRDYEMYVGHTYAQKGYEIDYFGAYMGVEDLGRDLIAKNGDEVLIIQCKYWSEKKQIHEKHITQLYGTMISYCIEHGVDKKRVKGLLVTNINLSPMAKKMAAFLGIEYTEEFQAGDYPCIKCNIGRGELGEVTKIYHLPFDQQYDSTKITEEGEFYAATVAEAERAGFRRAYKWHGIQ